MDGQYEATPVDPGAIPRQRRAVEAMPSVPARSRHGRLSVDPGPVRLHDLIPQQDRRR